MRKVVIWQALFLALAAVSAHAQTAAAGARAVVTSETVPVYASMSQSAQVRFMLKRGDTVVIGLVSDAALPIAEPLITGAAETAAVPARPMPPATRIANRVPRIFETPLLCVSTSNEITACPARFVPLALHAKAGFSVFVSARYQLRHDEFVAAPECISTGRKSP